MHHTILEARVGNTWRDYAQAATETGDVYRPRNWHFGPERHTRAGNAHRTGPGSPRSVSEGPERASRIRQQQVLPVRKQGRLRGSQEERSTVNPQSQLQDRYGQEGPRRWVPAGMAGTELSRQPPRPTLEVSVSGKRVAASPAAVLFIPAKSISTRCQ